MYGPKFLKLKQGLGTIVGERNYLLARAFYRTYPVLGRKPTLLIHTMGKVGSSTLTDFLRGTGIENDYSIIRPTWVSDAGVRYLEDMENEGFGGWENFPDGVKAMIARCDVERKLLQGIKNFKVKPKVITLIRDPVAIDVSNFFHNFKWWPKELLELCEDQQAGYMEQLERHFLNFKRHDMPLVWFDTEFEDIFHIDVLSSEFPVDQGYKIYEGDYADVLLMRLESLNACVAKALVEFLGIEEVNLVNTNVAEKKWYGSIYEEFKKTVALPEDYLNTMYDWTYARHFYSMEELETFREKWGKRAPASVG
jgi:hypothetical protein